MSFDWNWFFSAFAQCGAAIIGIFGAFIISKILNNTNSFHELQNELKNIEFTHHDLFKRLKQVSFDDYFEYVIKTNQKIYELFESGKLDESAKTIKYVYLHGPLIYKSDTLIRSILKSIKNSPGGYKNLYNNYRDTYDISIQKMKPIIDDLKFQSERNIEKCNFIRNKLDNLLKSFISLKVIIIFLSIALFSTVIYPLHFLPLAVNQNPTISINYSDIIFNIFSMKGLFLFIFLASFGAMLIYFFVSSNNVTKKINIILNDLELKKLSDLSEYSNYFGVISI